MRGSGVDDSKWHDRIGEGSPRRYERGLAYVFFSHFDLIVTRVSYLDVGNLCKRGFFRFS